MEFLDIAEVTARTGQSASALRYYEKRGLIEALARKGLRRQYEPSVLPRLALIRLCQTAGFTLEQIAALLPPQSQRAPAEYSLDREAISQRADDIDAQIEELQSLSQLLRHIAKCAAPNHSECPTFQANLAAITHASVKA